MIAIEDVENHILTNTNVKVVSCLRLSGFQSFVDYMIFTETTLQWIEKYVGVRCGLMSTEKRLEFIDEYFLNDPEKYMFPVPLRHRLLNAISDLHRESERLMGTINNSSNHANEQEEKFDSKVTVEELEYLSDVDNKFSCNDSSSDKSLSGKDESDFVKSENIDFQEICQQQTMQVIPENERKFYEEIVQFASEEFIECYLMPKSDFNLILPDFSSENCRFIGRFHCLICDYAMKKRSKVVFKIRPDQKIQYTKIRKHLAEHYTLNPDATEVRKHNRVMKRKADAILKKVAKINENHNLPLEIITAQKNVNSNRNSVPIKRKKMTSLLNDIITVPNPFANVPVSQTIIIQSKSIVETAPEKSETKKVFIKEYHESTQNEIFESQMHEPIESAEVTIGPLDSEEIIIEPLESVEVVIEPIKQETEHDQSDSDIGESNLTICM